MPFGVMLPTIRIRRGSIPLFSKVSTGYYHTIAIGIDGSLWGWGRNNNYQLGLGVNSDKLLPTRIGVDSDWVDVSCGDEYTLALKSNGKLYGWGRNDLKQAGQSSGVYVSIPTQIGSATNWNKLIVKQGVATSAAIKNDNTLYVWGRNLYGECMGAFAKDNPTSSAGSTATATPTQVTTGSLYWVDFSIGTYHSIGLTTTGKIYTSGSNQYGQLGIPLVGHGYGGDITNLTFNTAKYVVDTLNISDNIVCAVANNSFIRNFNSSDTVPFGAGVAGSRGDGTTTTGTYNPSQTIRTLNSSDFKKISARSQWFNAVTTTGRLYEWGSSPFFTSISTPFDSNQASSASSVSTGFQHTAVLMTDGTLWTKGYNTFGQCGNNTTSTIATLTQIN